MSFQAVIGHNQPISVLQRAIASGRVPPGYLFAGPPNVGKTLVAVELAKALNCLDEGHMDPAPDSCGQCEACRKIEKGIHPDVRLVRPLVKLQEDDDESKKPSKRERRADDSTREVFIEGSEITRDQVAALMTQAHLHPVEARRKVFVIERAETMNPTAANRLLKTLEEPPGDTTFILTTAKLPDLLPTIISRCQSIHFQPVPAEQAGPALREMHPDTVPETVEAVVALSGGRFGWAHTLLSRPEVMAQRSALLDLAVGLPGRQMFDGMRLAEDLIEIAEAWWSATEEGKLAAKLFKSNRDRVLRTMMGDVLDVLLTWFRDMTLVAADPGTQTIVNRDRAVQLAELAGRYRPTDCVRASRWIENTKVSLRQNANLRLACEALMVRLISLTAIQRR